MSICLVGKYPPLQGGVSTDTWDAARELALRGYRVDIVTNADETQPGYRQSLAPDDLAFMEPESCDGCVRVHRTIGLPDTSYVPWAQPFVTKLLGRTLSVIEAQRSTVIVGWYLEPFGVVAALAANATGLPLLLKHGGSDLGRLAAHPDLRYMYRWALSGATAVATTRHARDQVLELGVLPHRLMMTPAGRSSQHLFQRASPLVLKPYAGAVDHWVRQFAVPHEVAREIASRSEAGLDPALLTVGLYGKVANSKGSFDFLRALEHLAINGSKCNVLACIGGDDASVRRFLLQAHRRPPAAGATVVLPFVPPWRVPGFLQLCQIVAYLERDFPIALHRSSVPTEVMLSGTCLLISSDALRQQVFADDAVDGRSVSVVPNPREHSKVAERLASLVRDPDMTREIGLRGRALIRGIEASLPCVHPNADVIDDFAQPHLGDPERHFSYECESTRAGHTSVGTGSPNTRS